MQTRMCSDSNERTFSGDFLCTNNTSENFSLKDTATKPSYRQIPCGYCGVTCIYDAIEIGFIIGIIANALVIVRVIKDKRLRDPTFIGIAALAVPDLLFLVLNLIISFETVILSFTCQKPVIKSRPWYIMNSMIWFSANSHVALLAVLRYLSIIYPIKSSIYLTPTKVVIMSACVWSLGICLLGILAGLITLKIVLPGTSSEFIIIWWITVYLIPLTVTTLLHILKMCRVKMSIKESTTASTRRSIRRMSKIVPLVIIMATVLPLPKLVYNSIRTFGNDGNHIFPSKTFKLHFEGISHLVYLINHCINPFIYGFLSKKFRKSLKEMFSCSSCNCNINKIKTQLVPRKSRISSCDTVSRTNISSISSVDSIENPKKCQRVCSFDSDDNKKY
ncbi:somatostatin receptor type 2-like [Ruditapes philippinarum]|uniref:somatostatin receptor type 2-like n=1 Tax=Ruditapes philippinarum TaxID=129788 RepID=UPI00295B7108|nr:somatostatin receptor type 2-like [Ruditapes philippinarum]